MSGSPRFPLADLRAQYRTIQAETDAAIREVLESCAFVRGEPVGRFERAFAAYCAAAGCVGTANGTDAIYLALRALGIGPGDDVITVAHTFIGTIEGIVLAGATPVFVDVDDDTLLMRADLVEPVVTARTRAIVPVHLYGQPCDMDAISALAARHGLKVIEDAAQAHGARWRGRPVGGLGDAGCFSFFPSKNLGAYGDGGAVTSQDARVLQAIRGIANHGRRDKYTHDVVGVNSRLDTLQAAVLNVKLDQLEQWNEARRALARRYDGAFANSGVRPVATSTNALPVYHLYVVRVPAVHRDRIIATLNAEGIGAAVHYPLPAHRQPALAAYPGAQRSLPVAERAAHEVISLPLYPEMPPEAVDWIAGRVKAALAAGGG